MNESMRKIVYYENILEFKQNTNSQLNLQEVNNWKLCRTCLSETQENDMELEKRCVMDAVEGRLLTVQEMLVKFTPLQPHKYKGLPLRMCKDCLEKTTTLYFFSIQVKKAEEVLIKLSEQFNVPDNVVEHSNELEVTSEKYEDISQEIYRNNNRCADTIKVEKYEKSVDSTGQINKESCVLSTEVDADKNVETFKEEYEEVLSDHENESGAPETISEACHSEEHLESIGVHMEITSTTEECHEDSNNVFVIPDDSLDEVYLIDQDGEDVEYKCSTSKIMTSNEETEEEYVFIEETGEHAGHSKQSKQPSRVRKKPLDIFRKHKQPRVTKPLLENIKCAVCEKIFHRQCDLVIHVKLNHPNSKAFQCRDCEALFSHTQSLSRHMNTHKPNVNKNTCEYCSKGFLRPEDLKRHIRVHTGERPYSCPLCEKSFKQQGEMKQHMTIHLEHKQYKCIECNRIFASRNSLYLHRKNHIANSDQLTFSNRKDLHHQKQEIDEEN